MDSTHNIETITKSISRGKQYHFLLNSNPVSYDNGMKLLRDSANFRTTVANIIKSCGYNAVFWEFVPVTRDLYNSTPFEFVLMNAQSLQGISESRNAFQSHFTGQCTVVSFYNLGRDALLIAPCPNDEHTTEDFSHLSKFISTAADPSQIQELFITVGDEVDKMVRGTERTIWVSTSGLGVYWLHVRLDTIPKYYTHYPYKNPKYKSSVF